jgi:hypothetical protein
MVSKRLPTKVTHITELRDSRVNPSITYVRKSLTSIILWASCHQINAEAGTMLSCRVATIREIPVRTVVTTIGSGYFRK